MQVPAHHPHQELIAQLLSGIAGVPHLEALKMVSNCAREATDEYIKLEQAIADAASALSPDDACDLSLAVKRILSRVAELEARDPWDDIEAEEFARFKEAKDKDGKTQILLEGPLFRRLIWLLGLLLKDHPGYVEFRCESEKLGEILVTCQKVEEPTPSEKVSAYRDAFMKLRARLSEFIGGPPMMVCKNPFEMALDMLEEEWKEVPNEEKYRDADEDHDRESVQIEGADAGEPSELPSEGERSP